MTPALGEPREGPQPAPLGGRLRSLDAYRGFVMLLMASGGLGLAQVASNYSEAALLADRDEGWVGPVLDRLAFHVEHVSWVGCSAWDLIQPSFMFIVGVAMPFSYASRRAGGQSPGRLFGHALTRSAMLIALGIFLSSNGSKFTNWTFVNVLTQIGLGYPFVFLLLGRSPRVQVGALLAVLAATWALFAGYPLPGPEFDRMAVGLPFNWNHLSGLASHWEKNTNVAAAFDRWFLNLFPHPDGTPFRFNEGGYTTLNFIPSIATMLSGVLAGEWLRSHARGRAKVLGLVLAGALSFALGTMLDTWGVCPCVKRIWTPSWVLYSTGWTCWLLALFVEIIDVRGFSTWAYPLTIVGLNSIAIYVMAQLLKPWIRRTLQIHLGTLGWWLRERCGVPLSSELLDGVWGPFWDHLAVVAVLWLCCWALYRRRIFVKI